MSGIGTAKRPKIGCRIPARTLPPCDLDWGHEGDLHSNAGDGFYAREYDREHHQRQHTRRSDEDPNS
jgi:hypothetical protein